MRAIIIRLPGTFLFALLASLFILAFVVSPYWFLAESPFARVAILAATIGLGTIWCLVSSSELELRFTLRDMAVFAVLLVAVFCLNYRPLTAAIPWRGDEAHHIRIALYLAAQIPILWILAFLGLLAAFLISAWRDAKWMMGICGALLAIGAAAFLWRDGPFQGERPDWIFRYPFVNYWFYMPLPKAAGYLVGPYHEILYRIIPLAFAALLAYAFGREAAGRPGAAAFFWGLAAAAIPLVFYYSSILYLEPPAIFLMLAVCLRAESLLRGDFASLKRNPAWYALILLGLIKETTIVFLACFLAVRLAVRAWTGRGKAPQEWIRPLKEEFAVVYSVSMPILLYLTLRGALTDSRGFRPDLGSLLDPSVYRAIGQSFLEQFGPLLLLFTAGCVLLALTRQYASLAFSLFVLAATPLVFAVDSGGAHAGYSRFNLLILPVILWGALAAARTISEKGKFIGIAAACVVLSVNLLLSPVHMDGTKQPFWGNYLLDTSDHYYPYPEALAWLKENHGEERIFLTGFNYPYYFDFYFEQLGWRPRYKLDLNLLTDDYDEEFVMHFAQGEWAPRRSLDAWLAARGWDENALLSRALERAEAGGFDVVLYHVLGNELPQLRAGDSSRFLQAKVFQNQAHILAAYIRVR